MNERLFQEWLATRPPEIQKLAREFPPGSEVTVSGKAYYVVSYADNDVIGITPFPPGSCFDLAIENRQHVHAKCLREHL